MVYALVKLGVPAAIAAQAQAAERFMAESQDHRVAIRRQIDDLAAGDRSIVVWGGTGKAPPSCISSGWTLNDSPCRGFRSLEGRNLRPRYGSANTVSRCLEGSPPKS
uniref:Uncharacterized protein n=1 Tax=Phenylobacterium glaciei TaxID=2803784 RepID=A0A974S957_9CAUL|nr:hypothetical protein JKL49_13635 [Phenylobacterium glaciei]